MFTLDKINCLHGGLKVAVSIHQEFINKELVVQGCGLYTLYGNQQESSFKVAFRVYLMRQVEIQTGIVI